MLRKNSPIMALRADPASPRVRHQGPPRRITKQGNALVRWAAVEAVQRSSEAKINQIRTRISDRRGRPGHPGSGRNIAKVAAHRTLLGLVYYGLRDGHIRALDDNTPDRNAA